MPTCPGCKAAELTQKANERLAKAYAEALRLWLIAEIARHGAETAEARRKADSLAHEAKAHTLRVLS